MLAARRERVVGEGVALSDAAVPAIDEHFAALLAGDAPGHLDRFALCIEPAGDPLRAPLTDRPFAPSRDDVLAPS